MEQIKPKVVLLGYTRGINGEKPEHIIALAGKLCYSKSNINDLFEKLTDEQIETFINRLVSMGHQSPLEHISFNFGIEGISRTCSHQIVRHRIASYSQQSQRYVDLKETFNFIIPPEIENNEAAKNIYIDSIMKDKEVYKNITLALKEEYVKNGMDNSKATKKALEDARFALPNACETKMIMTMNARTLLNFFKERCCNRAQWEIQEVANQMLDLVLEVAPTVFKKAGSPCAFGPCPEGKMTCGNPIKPRVRQLENK